MVEAVVKFDFTGRSPEELTVRRTDLLKVLRTKSEVETYWYFAETNGRVGLVPENYIEMKPHSWFCELMSRKDAEHFLEDKEKGNFIIRHAESSPTLGSYSLSVKYDGKVKHFKICRDTDGMYVIWLRKFKTLNDLVDFHTVNSISKTQDVKLVQIDPEYLPTSEYQEDIEYNPHLPELELNSNRSTEAVTLIRNGLSILGLPDREPITTHDESHYKSPRLIPVASNPNGTSELLEVIPENQNELNENQASPSCTNAEQPVIFVQALYDFKAEEKDELGFQRGQIIKVTNQDDEHWWQGKIQDKHGQFPASHVIAFEPRL